MYPYIPNTEKDRGQMLEAIGVSSVEELFSDIPKEARLEGRLNINEPMSEIEVSKYIRAAAKENLGTDTLTCFLGAGAYDHYIPSVVKNIISRSEFYTAYTPYQPEISQGTLQSIFEYQTMICELTAMEVSNASMYDGATACAEAAIMSCEATKKKQIILSKTVHPEVRAVVKTYMKFRNIEVIEVESKDGETDIEELDKLVTDKTAGVIVQNPNFFGIIEKTETIEKITHSKKALLTMSVDPISLGILKAPGEIGADIAVGEAQSLGNSLNFGGPYIGFMAVSSKLMRKIPGRIVGETKDVDGKRAFVLTLQAREQHIRREKATSNICSNEGLNALAAAIYMTTLGKKGIKEVAYQCAQKAHYAYKKITENTSYSALFNKPFFKEFAIKSEISAENINSELLKNNILGGFELENQYDSLKNSILFCVTEKRTRDEIDKLAAVLGGIK